MTNMKINSLVSRQNCRVPPEIWIASSALLLGFLYYGLFRDHHLVTSIPGFVEHRAAVTQYMPWGYHALWLPSFLHAFATLLFSHGFLIAGSAGRSARWRLGIFASLIAFELFMGVADTFDILAIFAAGLAAEIVAYGLRSRHSFLASRSRIRQWAYHRFSVLGLVGLSGLLAAGSGFYGLGSGSSGGTEQSFNDCARFEGGSCIEFKQDAAPLYLSYQALRESVSVENARTPANIGRVYLYQNYVLLNEKNKGIHIIDNSDPAAPVNLGFINIPGNTDIAMRSNYLYADSYIDLITLDLNDPANVQVINRQEDLFPYDAYQNIPYNVSFRNNGIDSRLGVVVAYQLLGN